ncbi:hypothetical protein PF005_g19605 [Phytophthora fragariae]|nr:hypothetical protein PF003_g2488 [Phytophthora fragariae]KAE9021031.1 hypothetical protein PR002_g12363 [Phytophthora rubi]KAE8929321.1 hypothetical protein PF009_g20557 [Phytophthora fragariae]KAE8979755.1 hypothetical protein PF011_g22718 [Phytophthora fragariae]KAE9036825.1 hypothetical protein PR001_g8637 [Phytophthora rubi]
MAIALQTALPPENEGTASVMTAKAIQVPEKLMSGMESLCRLDA